MFYLDVNIFSPVKSKIRAKNHKWHSEHPGKPLNKRTLISEVVRPAFEEVLKRKETVTNAFRMTGLYPFNPLAANRSKLKPGESYQTLDVTEPDDNVYDVVVNVATADIPEDVIVMDAVPLSPEPGPSSAPDHPIRYNALPETALDYLDQTALWSPPISPTLNRAR